MLAIAVLLLLQLPPLTVLPTVIEVPAHRAVMPVIAVGRGLTTTVFVAVLVQPIAFVPVTVYVVVADGVAVTEAPLVADSPVVGLHE
jgi:hypothetical protein